MRFYNGSMTFYDIMEMPYNLFMMFYDYMIYLLNMETPEGQKKNKLEDKKLGLKYGNATIDNDIQNFKKRFFKS